jgi:SpoVK/Ycf46/Vps4 family AAA+-type ATPase
MKTDDFEDLIKLLALRALHHGTAMHRFVRKDKFYAQDVARALSLYQWMDESENGDIKDDSEFKFDRKSIFRRLKEDWQATEASACETGALGPPNFERNCEMLQTAYGLNDAEAKLLRLKLLQHHSPILKDAVAICETRSRKAHIEMIAAMLKESPAAISQAIHYNGRLIKLNLLNWSKGRDAEESLQLTDCENTSRFCDQACELKDIIRDVASPSPQTSLSYPDYPNLKETLSPLRRHIRQSLRSKKPGVNIFIYGSPGTGKSELTRVIAREMRAQLYEISCEAGDGTSFRPTQRMDSLVKAGEIMKLRRTLLVFDEAEDIFRAPSLFSSSLASERKAWMNQMLENNPVPTFWVSNSLRGIDPAFTRRFDFIFEVEQPPRNIRQKMYRKICGSQIPQETITKIAACDALAPAIVARARNVAEQACEHANPENFQQVFEARLIQTLKAQGHDTKALTEKTSKVPKVYALDYLNCSQPLHTLAPALAKQADCRICLYGPPGTGKTTLGQWLARETDRPIHVKKASDLLSQYLGGTERALADAFEEAEEEKAILMIDEVDSFLQDRRDAQRSWEVQQVNELLTQMESFKGTFIASTNLMDGIDPAAMRRFDLKLHFDYLSAAQTRSLFARYMKQLRIKGDTSSADDGIVAMGNCTPGDFANVARQHHFRQFAHASAFAEAILQECRLKKENSTRKLGFAL